MTRLDYYEYNRGETKWVTNVKLHRNDLPIDWEELAEEYNATVGWYADEDDDCGIYDPTKSGMYFEFADDKDATVFLLRWS